jgi:hypothetical protein
MSVTQFKPKSGVVVSDVRHIGKGALVSIFNVEVPSWHLVLKDCKLFEKNGEQWVGLPSTSYTNREGKTVYKDLVEFSDDDAADRFQNAVLDDLK